MSPSEETSEAPAIRVMMMPRDTNAEGTIFGGVIFSYMDQAGAVEARKHTKHRVVTVAIDGVEFHEPVFVGDVLSFYTSLVKQGRTSLTIWVSVEAARHRNINEVAQVTSATLTYVAINDERRPVPVDSPL